MEKQIEDLKKRSEYMEDLLEQIVKSSNPIETFRDSNNYLVLAREWNSWYPSTFQVLGGCYFFNLNEEIIVIDPGFNTLEKIIEHQLDVRLIRHIFLTHFHPDHFDNLSKLLTRLSSKEHKISVYLNTTSYNQFKIYMKENTEFYELIPGNIIKLETIEKEDRFNIEIEITKAFHREIGGSMHSIGLKFILKHNQNSNVKFIIGFMSDTDGSEKYIKSYIEDYNDCDILIPHLGSIHSKKKPMGYKHLYLKGTEELLQCLNDEKNRVIFLGEFGLELASDQMFFDGLTHFTPPKICYMDITKNILKILHTKFQEDNELAYNKPIILLLMRCLEKILNEIQDNPFIKLEVLLPFILFDKTSIELYEKDGITVLLNRLEKKIENFLRVAQEANFKSVWWSVLKKVAFQVEKTDEYEKNLITFMDNVGLIELRKIMDENCKLLLPLFSDSFKEKFSFLRIIPSYGNPSSSLDSLLPNGIELEVNQFPDFIHKLVINFRSYIKNDGIINFCGPDNFLHTFFNNQEIFKNPKFKWFVFIFTIYFLIKALEVKAFNESETELKDGRSIVCKYLQDKTKKTVIPVNDSYSIIFNKVEMRIEGYCEYNHRTEIPISKVNQNWKFFPNNERISKKSKNLDSNKEFINVIPIEDCMKCIINLVKVKYKEQKEKEIESVNDQAILEQDKETIKQYEDKLRGVSNLKDLFEFYSTDFMDVIYGINSKILKEKVSELIQKTNFSPQEIILYLIHPKLIQSEVIREIIDFQLKKLTKDQIFNLISEIFNNPLPYNEIKQEPVYLYLFFNNDFSKLIISKIEDNINLEFLVKALKYFNNLLKYRKKNYIKYITFFKFIKQKAIDILYPLIENPSEYKQEYKMLKNYEDFIDWLENLEPPLDIYAHFLYPDFEYLKLRLLKESKDNSRDLKYHFL